MNLDTFLKGLFTNYVTNSSVVFDHPPTYSYALAIALLMTTTPEFPVVTHVLTTQTPLLRYVICERPQSMLRENQMKLLKH